jgi:hypothetical protein
MTAWLPECMKEMLNFTPNKTIICASRKDSIDYGKRIRP